MDAHERFFGTDGIRDEFGKGRLTPDNLHRIGRAIGAFARERIPGEPRVFSGRDTRESGPELLRGLARGLAAERLTIEDGGVLPTPAIAWWTATGGCDVGIALTASHNPARFNGVKVFLGGGRKTSEEEEDALDAKIRALAPVGVGLGQATPRTDVLGSYLSAATAHLVEGGRLDGLSVILDCANGATQRTAPEVVRRLGGEPHVLAVPSHEINDGCGTEHPAKWQEAVVVASAGAGLAFDGDGDRVLLCDEAGRVLDGDDLLHLLASDLNARKALPDRVVVATVMSNMGLQVALGEEGILLERVPVGDRNVATRMREIGAALGGEQSGHVVQRWGDALIGDGVVAGVMALQAARRRRVALSSLRAETPRYPQALVNVRVKKKLPIEQVPSLREAVEREEQGLLGRGRVLVRYSGTEPLLRIMVEAPDRATVDAVAGRLRAEAERLAL
jgi:phosphoglucosamine mutase